MSLVRLVKAAVVRPFIRNEKVAELLYTVEKRKEEKKIHNISGLFGLV